MAENKIYAVLTDRGAQLEAAALASGVPVVLNKFVIGDANGNDDVTPDPARTALIHETYRGDIKSAENSGNQVIFTLYVPPDTGGYTIRDWDCWYCSRFQLPNLCITIMGIRARRQSC